MGKEILGPLMPSNTVSHHFEKPMENVKSDFIFYLLSYVAYFTLTLTLKHTMFSWIFAFSFLASLISIPDLFGLLLFDCLLVGFHCSFLQLRITILHFKLPTLLFTPRTLESWPYAIAFSSRTCKKSCLWVRFFPYHFKFMVPDDTVLLS